MSAPAEKILVSSTRKRYAVAPAATSTLLSRNELRSIGLYVAGAGASTSGIRPHGESARASRHIPALPFERVLPRHDALLLLSVSPVRCGEPALDVPLRFAAPEEFRLPPMEDPPARLPLARRVGALIRGSECVAISWAATANSASAAASAAVAPGPTAEKRAANLRDAEARAASALRSGGEALAADLFAALAALHYGYGNTEAALAAFDRAAELYEAVGSAKGLAFCLNLSGLCHARLGDHRMALVLCRWLEALGAGYVRCVAQINTGVAYAALGELQFAAQALEDAVASAQEVEDPMLETVALGDLGIVALRSGNMRAAQGHLEQCLERCSLAGDKGGAAVCLLLLGQVYSRIHDYAHAAFYYEHAMRVGGDAGLPDVVATARVSFGVARGSAALRERVLAEAAAMGRVNTVGDIVGALPQ